MSSHSGTIFAIVDGGTTNIRVTLTEENRILAKGYAGVGARDRVVHEDEDILITGIKRALEESLSKCDSRRIETGDIDYAIFLGMLTSNVGLLDLEHLTVPAGVEELAHGLVVTRFPDLLPCPTIFIRGVKNALEPVKGADVSPKMDTMRSEETQTMGILDLLPELPLPTLITFLTSHTKFVRVNVKGQITDSLTTMSGQVYDAIKHHTYLSKYIPKDKLIRLDEIQYEDLWSGIKAERDMGFLRSIHMPRFMDVVLKASAQRCYSYLLGTLIGSDLRSFYFLRHVMPFDFKSLVFIGNFNRPQLYLEVLNEEMGKNTPAYALDEEGLEEAGVRGAIKIFRYAKRSGSILRS
jgi:2-dehydro-3-deoxygalactonokinase